MDQQEERLMIPLPLRARRLIASGTLLPIKSCIEASTELEDQSGIKHSLETLALEDRSLSSHFLNSVRMSSRLSEEVVGQVPLMNILPRLKTVAEERSLLLSLPDDEERLRGIMSHVLVRSLWGWRGRVVYRMDASRWKMELHIPLGLDEGDCIFSTLTNAHDSPERSTSPASYHGEILDFDEDNE